MLLVSDTSDSTLHAARLFVFVIVVGLFLLFFLIIIILFSTKNILFLEE